MTRINRCFFLDLACTGVKWTPLLTPSESFCFTYMFIINHLSWKLLSALAKDKLLSLCGAFFLGKLAFQTFHKSNVTCASWRLKSPDTRLRALQLVEADIEKTTFVKGQLCWKDFHESVRNRIIITTKQITTTLIPTKWIPTKQIMTNQITTKQIIPKQITTKHLTTKQITAKQIATK